MPRITALIGVIGSGKDWRASGFVKDGAKRVDFKDSLLETASRLVGYNIAENYNWFKMTIVGIKKPANPVSEGMIMSGVNEMLKTHPDLMTGRRLLQRLGSDVFREEDPDWWANKYKVQAARVLLEGRDVVTADCRFPNEVRAILALNREADFIFCNYRSARYDAKSNHVSEQMAQRILAAGFTDGQYIPREVLDGIAAVA